MIFFSQLEHQRQQLLQERQQFHLEQLRAAESRQRQLAAQQLLNEGKLTMPTAQSSSSIQQTVPPQQSISIVTNGNSNATVTSSLSLSSSSSSIPSPVNNQNTVVNVTTNASDNNNIQRPPSRPPSQQAPISNPHVAQDLQSNGDYFCIKSF